MADEGAWALEIRDLHRSYGALRAVDGLDFAAARGQITAVLGPNGAGKTTTIEICEGLRTADSGSVRVLGLPPGRRELKHRVGVMPQQAGAYPGARCVEMVRLVAAYFADPLDPDALVAQVGLTDAARTPFRRLSGGQQQRLSLAMALVGRPELLFLDEPSAGLDVQGRHLIWDLLRSLRETGVSIVLTTHALDEAAALADQVVIVDRGQVRAAGTVAELTAGTGALRFRAPPDLDVAALSAALPAGFTATEAPPGHYVVEGEISPQILASVTAWTAERGALAQDLHVGRQSLEDLFLALTAGNGS